MRVPVVLVPVEQERVEQERVERAQVAPVVRVPVVRALRALRVRAPVGPVPVERARVVQVPVARALRALRVPVVPARRTPRAWCRTPPRSVAGSRPVPPVQVLPWER